MKKMNIKYDLGSSYITIKILSSSYNLLKKIIIEFKI